MPPALPVELNRRSLHSIDVAGEFETSESFSVVLTNHGEAVHVHLHLDDELSRAASIPAGNHYVDAESTESVSVTTNVVDEPIRGKLKVVTGYGAETVYVTVTVLPRIEESSTVEVDESLSRPQRPEPEPSAVESVAGSLDDRWPVVAVAVLAVLLAVAVGLYVQSAAALVGTAAVAVAALVAILLAFR